MKYVIHVLRHLPCESLFALRPESSSEETLLFFVIRINQHTRATHTLCGVTFFFPASSGNPLIWKEVNILYIRAKLFPLYLFSPFNFLSFLLSSFPRRSSNIKGKGARPFSSILAVFNSPFFFSFPAFNFSHISLNIHHFPLLTPASPFVSTPPTPPLSLQSPSSSSSLL